LTFKNKLAGGVLSAAAILIFVAALSYRNSVRNTQDRKWVVHTYQVADKLSEILQGMTDAETGERGYILTGEEFYLKPYIQGLKEVQGGTRELRKLTADNFVQQRSLDALEPLIQERLRELQERIEVRRAAGLEAGATAVREGAGREYMEKIRIAIARMKAEEDRLLVLRTAGLEASSRQTQIAVVVGDSLGLLFLAAAGLVIYGEMRQRSRAEEEIRKLNEGLERKVAERTAELAERALDLERSNRDLQQFAYVASHDLQEPLRTVASFTQLLAKRYGDKLDDKAREFIGFAVDGSKRMQTLINDLLSFSRVGTQGKALGAVNSDAALDAVLKGLKRSIEESGAVITRDRLPTVLADEGQLTQLLQNLVANAIKFQGAGVPRIHIGAERNGSEWKVSVRDNGIGIAPEHHERIFVIFQRLHNKKQYPGTGIGLAVCKKIAERHGGRIWVEATAGGGSTFRFTIRDGEDAQREKESNEYRSRAAAR
jgi:signal transduction histidine kinase